MRFTSNTALGLALVLSLGASGCGLIGSLKPGKKGTMSCSCGMTGCGCEHCTGESSECHCTATDAYPDRRVGDGHD